MKTTLLAAAFTAAAFACPLAAQTQTNSYPVDPFERPYTGATREDVPRETAIVQPGMRVQVLAPTLPGYHRNGVLRSVTADSISLQTAGGETVTLPLSGVDGISMSLGRSPVAGALRGAWIGAVAGGVLLPISGASDYEHNGFSLKTVVKPVNFAIGAAAGALVGAAWGREVWRRAARATPAELGHVRRERTASAPGVSVAPYAAAPISPETGRVAAGLSIRF